MPRRQRFKPSRKPKPAIEQSEVVMQSAPQSQDMNPGDTLREAMHPDAAEERIPR